MWNDMYEICARTFWEGMFIYVGLNIKTKILLLSLYVYVLIRCRLLSMLLFQTCHTLCPCNSYKHCTVSAWLWYSRNRSRNNTSGHCPGDRRCRKQLQHNPNRHNTILRFSYVFSYTIDFKVQQEVGFIHLFTPFVSPGQHAYLLRTCC